MYEWLLLRGSPRTVRRLASLLRTICRPALRPLWPRTPSRPQSVQDVGDTDTGLAISRDPLTRMGVTLDAMPRPGTRISDSTRRTPDQGTLDSRTHWCGVTIGMRRGITHPTARRGPCILWPTWSRATRTGRSPPTGNSERKVLL